MHLFSEEIRLVSFIYSFTNTCLLSVTYLPSYQIICCSYDKSFQKLVDCNLNLRGFIFPQTFIWSTFWDSGRSRLEQFVSVPCGIGWDSLTRLEDARSVHIYIRHLCSDDQRGCGVAVSFLLSCSLIVQALSLQVVPLAGLDMGSQGSQTGTTEATRPLTSKALQCVWCHLHHILLVKTSHVISQCSSSEDIDITSWYGVGRRGKGMREAGFIGAIIQSLGHAGCGRCWKSTDE